MIGITADQATDPQVDPQAEPAPPPVRRRILIVDDDTGQTEVLAYRFAKQGFETITAHTGKSGMVAARRDHPDLIVMDIQMPDIDGLTACQQLSDDPETCHIPVIILSADDQPDVIRRSRSAGCRYFVSKPYDPNALLTLAMSAIQEANHW